MVGPPAGYVWGMSESRTFLDVLGIRDADPDKTGRAGEDAGMALTTTDDHVNRNGSVHGGVIATLLDAVMGRAARNSLDEGQSTATISMTVTYLRPGKVGEEITASAEIRKSGSSVVMVEGDVTAEDGEPIAHGVATYTVFDD